MASSDSADLTDIDNIGPSTADNLRDAGLETVEDVVDADDETLEDALSSIPGFSPETLEEVRHSATELHADEMIGEIEEFADELDEESEDTSASEGPDFHDVTFETSGIVSFHVINSVVQEALRMRRRNRFEDEETLYGIAFQMMEDLVAEDHPLDAGNIEFSFRVTRDDLNYVHQAVSAGTSNYRSESGLPSIWADLDDVTGQLNNARQELRE